MEKLQGTVPILRKAAIITLVGFLVITLAGPLLTIAGVLLPFALVGLLVWIPFRGIMMWKQGGWSAVGDTVKRGLGRMVAIPAWIVARAFGAVAFVLGSAFSLVGFVLGLILPVLLGTVGGAVLGLIGGMEHQDADFRVPAGALIGAVVGLLAGALRSRSKPVRTVVVVRPAPQELRHA
ncbi:MAG TPA: hypothetical protein VGY66_37635 [Gemmataceae bacterium]|jgi:hypothetical protein|nr:hypothetical protein [Gemmataceae bacterium]